MEKFLELTKQLDTVLKRKYERYLSFPRETLRQEILQVGTLKELLPLSKEKMESYCGKVCAVDGSNQRIGGNYPHYVDVFRACGICGMTEQVFSQTYLSPLIDDISRENEMTWQKKTLAKVEMEAALQALEQWTPKIFLMDGSLIRYEISDPERWAIFRKKVLDQNILVVGVIEDIKTNHIARQIPLLEAFLYDREIMYHLLNVSEMLLLQQTGYGKSKYDYVSAFLRSANDPAPVGLDMLLEQEEHLEWMGRLIVSMTDPHSRGIPIPLDLADQACKVKKQELEQILKNYLSRDLYEIFFHAERNKRSRLYE